MRHPNKRATAEAAKEYEADWLFPLMRHPNKRATSLSEFKGFVVKNSLGVSINASSQ
jgi:hypothetical protein